MDVPWRNVAALGAWHNRGPKDQLAIVASVTRQVGSLSVGDDGGAATKENDANTAKAAPATSVSELIDTIVAKVDSVPDKIAAAAGSDNDTTNVSPPTNPTEHKTCDNQANKITTEKITHKDTAKQRNTWKRKAKTDRKEQNSLEDSNKAQEKVGAALGKRMGQNKENLEATTTAVFSNKKKKGEGSVLSATPAENDPGIAEEEEATSPGATGQLTGANVSACQKP
jgi:hypothetical protein